MSLYIHKSHNVTVLLYHLVFPAKYRRAVFDAAVDQALRDVCLGIEARYQLKFLEIGTDRDHVHFLVQSVPTYSVTKLVTTIKSLTAREIFRHCPQVKRQLWGGEFWTDGYFASTVGRHGNEAMFSDYVKKQGQDYQKLRENCHLLCSEIPRRLRRGSFICRKKRTPRHLIKSSVQVGPDGTSVPEVSLDGRSWHVG